MPLMQCSKDGKSGWKYGQSGHCYTGPDAKKKAAQQGAAIKQSQNASLIQQVIKNLSESENDNKSRSS